MQHRSNTLLRGEDARNAIRLAPPHEELNSFQFSIGLKPRNKVLAVVEDHAVGVVGPAEVRREMVHRAVRLFVLRDAGVALGQALRGDVVVVDTGQHHLQGLAPVGGDVHGDVIIPDILCEDDVLGRAQDVLPVREDGQAGCGAAVGGRDHQVVLLGRDRDGEDVVEGAHLLAGLQDLVHEDVAGQRVAHAGRQGVHPDADVGAGALQLPHVPGVPDHRPGVLPRRPGGAHGLAVHQQLHGNETAGKTLAGAADQETDIILGDDERLGSHLAEERGRGVGVAEVAGPEEIALGACDAGVVGDALGAEHERASFHHPVVEVAGLEVLNDRMPLRAGDGKKGQQEEGGE